MAPFASLARKNIIDCIRIISSAFFVRKLSLFEHSIQNARAPSLDVCLCNENKDRYSDAMKYINVCRSWKNMLRCLQTHAQAADGGWDRCDFDGNPEQLTITHLEKGLSLSWQC